MNKTSRRAILSIPRKDEQLVRQSVVQEGIVLVHALHITPSVFKNYTDGGLHHDSAFCVERLATE